MTIVCKVQSFYQSELCQELVCCAVHIVSKQTVLSKRLDNKLNKPVQIYRLVVRASSTPWRESCLDYQRNKPKLIQRAEKRVLNLRRASGMSR